MMYALITIWLLCGLIDYGYSVDFLQRNWPEQAYQDRYTDRIHAAIFIIGGPISLLTTALTWDFKGWRL